ncbi:hypothetical protein IM793_08970 [Pedobacter sp. MR2016-19]|uniref:hypothetical protein n=1 Tax=Pedobacter sp. MR2016-19 TaxID=2780089 RepID=UPI001873AC25|nr:hypothetical protein [Pedobacter sp. MR2016-19]MBE5319287.1 hypothetical protein [Pedobacter sp. MR2016-19]
MESIYLENNLKLSFEKLQQTIRLIVSRNDEEWVCRKEKLENLIAFTDINQAHIFKGRLQLIKLDDNIGIQVNNKCISTISAEKFKQALNNLR